MNGPAFSLIFSMSIKDPPYCWIYLLFILDSFELRVIPSTGQKFNFFIGIFMPSKDGKIFDTIVYIGLGVNALVAVYLLLMKFEVIWPTGNLAQAFQKCQE